MTTAVSGTVLLAAVLFSSHYEMRSTNFAVQWMYEPFCAVLPGTTSLILWLVRDKKMIFFAHYTLRRLPEIHYSSGVCEIDTVNFMYIGSVN
jgi:hypothetical protein